MATFDDFKTCCHTEAHVQLETLAEEVLLPFIRFGKWWTTHPTMRRFIASLTAKGAIAQSGPHPQALQHFLTALLDLSENQAALLWGTLVEVVVKGIQLEAAMTAVVSCALDIEYCNNSGKGFCNGQNKQRCTYTCPDGHSFDIFVRCDRHSSEVPAHPKPRADRAPVART